MTIQQVLKKYSKIDETELFLSHLLKCTKTELYLNPQKTLSKLQLAKLAKMIADFKKGKPTAYILGYKYFFGFRFKVNKDVLIPRPESEWLVEQALEFIHHNPKSKLKILDLGTGSGCLAIAIAKYANASNLQISASDVSPKALLVAKQNAQSHGAKIKFIQSDLLQNISDNFDVIIANLPYVPISDYKKLRNNLKYEPLTALTDGTNDFILYRILIDQIVARNQTGDRKHPNQPKLILFEIDPVTKPLLMKLVKQHFPNFRIRFQRDLQRLWRYAILES